MEFEIYEITRERNKSGMFVETMRCIARRTDKELNATFHSMQVGETRTIEPTHEIVLEIVRRR